ncbi:MAG: aminotransferase class I/II-fold pyridoxal phosphate-dependent enzyme [Candidatus Eremiobacteraeota bacterium]|nr:aminotransferase class I/II-fold pyridoxal phosphate-dependent enzyme [Candidatus Eremiobacteraeota bacterium]
MHITPSQRASKVTYAIRNIVHEAKKVEALGKKVIYCNIGDPNKFDFRTPPAMIEAVHQAMLKGENGYAPSSGIQEAREAVARHAREHNGIDTNPEMVFITAGASEAIEIALTALLDVGDDVLTPAPGYPLYHAVVTKIGARLNPYYLDEARGWLPDLEDIKAKITPRTKGIVIINPNNPTGAVYDRETLLSIIEIARSRRLIIFADEIYDKLIFDKSHISLASLCDDVPVITLNGLSKSYLAPGWRTGWMIIKNLKATDEYFLTIRKLLDARLCSVGPQQFAIKAALEGSQDHIRETLAKLRERRDLIHSRLNSIGGISCVKPESAFYAMPRLDSERFATDEDFVLELVRETGVLFVHGSGFEIKPGKKYFRVVYLPQTALLKEALDLLEHFMKKKG